MRHVGQANLRAEAAGKGHFGQGDGQAAFAQVVAGADQAASIAACTAANVRLASGGSTWGTRGQSAPSIRAALTQLRPLQ